MIKIAVNGAAGRMGARILELAGADTKNYRITGAFEHPDSIYLGSSVAGVKIRPLGAEALQNMDVLIDFSTPSGTLQCVRAVRQAGKRLVIGTTGLDETDLEKVRLLSKKTAVLFSPNMSLGANFLFELARLAARALKNGYDIEIIEAHHRLKKDAPSGTAKKLAEVIAETRGWDLKKAARYGRKGLIGARSGEEIGIHVIRGGDIVGEHTVLFSGPGEKIEIAHTALSRDTFARGALLASEFIAKKKTGLYGMADVLGFKK